MLYLLHFIFILKIYIDAVKLFGNFENSPVTGHRHVPYRLTILGMLFRIRHLSQLPLRLSLVLIHGLSPLQPRPLVPLLHAPNIRLHHGVALYFFVSQIILPPLPAIALFKILRLRNVLLFGKHVLVQVDGKGLRSEVVIVIVDKVGLSAAQ